MDKIAPYYKALTALVVPTLTSLAASLAPQSDGGTTITASEWITSVVLGLVGGAAVFAAPRNQYRDDAEKEV